MIHVLSTGGTFEKAYNNGAGTRNFSFPETSYVKELCVRLGLSNISVSYASDDAHDSLDMDDTDRKYIADWCSLYDRSIVIHGTDTMLNTARVIAKHCPNKVIVLTGSLQPARMRDSDAEFNLGGAIIAAQLCTPGVYIVMSGQLFDWTSCKKDTTTGRFIKLL